MRTNDGMRKTSSNKILTAFYCEFSLRITDILFTYMTDVKLN